MSKTTALTPEEWKQLCILNVVQLKNFLDQLSVPAPEHMKLIDDHMERWRTFMGAWVASKPLGEAEQPQEAAPQVSATNGVEPPKRKGGWPRGKPRKPKVQSEAAVQ